MAERPAWNFWMYDNSVEGRRISIYQESIDELDIRSEDYDVDEEEWCFKPSWSAREAAYLSFSRDPSKVEEWEDDLSWFHPEAVALQDAI